jgi:hypothetical protein
MPVDKLVLAEMVDFPANLAVLGLPYIDSPADLADRVFQFGEQVLELLRVANPLEPRQPALKRLQLLGQRLDSKQPVLLPQAVELQGQPRQDVLLGLELAGVGQVEFLDGGEVGLGQLVALGLLHQI